MQKALVKDDRDSSLTN